MADHTAFAELLRALAKERARALVVGGLAKKLHGESAEAYDHTLWYDADEENVRCVYRALTRVGAPLDGVEPPDLVDTAYAFRYGEQDGGIELVGGLDGVTFADAWTHRLETHWNDVALCVIGRDALRASERSTRSTR